MKVIAQLARYRSLVTKKHLVMLGAALAATAVVGGSVAAHSAADRKFAEQARKSEVAAAQRVDAAQEAAPTQAEQTVQAGSVPAVQSAASPSATQGRTSGSVGPEIDKPSRANVKATKPLVMSPAHIVIYKNTNAARGVKTGIAEKVVTVSSSDGKAMYMPTPDLGSAVHPTATDFNARAAWAMTVSSSYASIGNSSITMSTTSVDGTVLYTGTFTMEVRPLPSFSVLDVALTGRVYTSNLLHTFDNPYYVDTFQGMYRPTVSIEGFACVEVTHADYVITCRTASEVKGHHSMTIVLENQFQRITLPANIYGY